MSEDFHLTEIIPAHLKPYTLEQNYSLYTDMDHAGWRYIMRVSQSFFKDHAHPKYLSGLQATGISTDRIPHISEMDKCLQKLGWRAVVVSGFIPPAIFLEFLSLGILPIACDMRSLNHLSYTPAPDIVHEAAGHAPIIADPEYSLYLRRYGEIATKVIFTSEDMNVYEAIRDLSEIKEDPLASSADVEKALARLDAASKAVTTESEATLLSRMAWWTTEYGLVGPISNPLIYGAGLLSSVGESYDCYSTDKPVPRVPLTIDCVRQPFDITKPQPLLFVTPDFHTLNEVLDELAETMSFKRGGLESLAKAVAAKTVTTVEFDSGLQLSGKLIETAVDKKGHLSFLTWEGPCQFSLENREISGEGPSNWKNGFCTPIGRIKNLPHGLWNLKDLSEENLKSIGLDGKKRCRLEYDSGIVIEGRMSSQLKVGGKILMFGFQDVKTLNWPVEIKDNQKFFILCASSVPHVFGDAADRVAFHKELKNPQPKVQTQKTNAPHHAKKLLQLYTEIRKMREQENLNLIRLSEIHSTLETHFKEDWLLRLEILELLGKDQSESPLAKKLSSRLQNISDSSETDVKTLIQRGLSLLD